MSDKETAKLYNETAKLYNEMSITLLDLKIKTNALTELLLEHTSVSFEDIDVKIDLVERRDFPGSRSRIKASLDEYLKTVK